jgi:hypothetical protein
MDTNGHHIPIAEPVGESLRDLQEQVQREQLANQLAEIKQSRKVLEQWGGDFANWVNPATPLFDSPDFFYPFIGENLPFNLDNRLKGELLPVYVTEYGLKLLRDYSRWMAAFNPYAISVLENRISYTIGKGMGITAVPSSRKPDFVKGDRELCEMCQVVWDDFGDRVDWGQWEQLILHKVDVDGEAFIRFFHLGGGKVTIRPVEPEHVRSPGDQSAHRSFGIETPEYDIMDTLGFWVVLNPGYSWTPRFVPAEEIVHFKANVGPSAKRGYPLLIPVRQNLQRALNLLQYMSALARAQSSIAMIRKHKQYSAASVVAWQQNNADVQGQSWLSGQQRFGKQYAPATVLDTPENLEYEFPGQKINSSALTEVLQAELRAIGSRVVQPEYMISANAENANYASTLVAEAPATKNFQRLQATLARKFGDGRKGEPKHCGVFWRVMRAAVEWGLLPREVMKRVKAHVEPPRVAARDEDKDTARSKTLNEAGVLSKETWSKQEGLERDREKSQIEKEQAEQPKGVPGQAPGQPGQSPGTPGAQPPGSPGTPPDGPQGPGKGPGVNPHTAKGAVDEKHLPAMAQEARSWLEEVFRLAGKKAPELDEQAIADALRGQLPGDKREMVEACEPNKSGKGFHDTKTGYPCSTGGAAGQASVQPSGKPNPPGQKPPAVRGLTAGGNESPGLSSISEKAAKILSSAKGGVKKQAIALAGKARAYAVKKFADLEAKYGRAGAIAVMSAVIAMTPVPVPGSSLAPILLAEGMRYVAGKLAKARPATESFEGAVRRLLQEAKDASGHEHKGEGPGGGQFTGDGGGGSSGAKPAKSNRRERPKYVGEPVDVEVMEFDPHEANAQYKKVIERLGSDRAGRVLESVKEYTDEAYNSLNSQMRKCPPSFKCLDPDMRGLFDDLEAAIDAAPPFKDPVTVYRAINVSPQLASELAAEAENKADDGSEFSLPSMTSTTLKASTALGFEKNKQQQQLMFHIKAKTGLYVDPISVNQGEEEIIQSPSTRYKVVGVADTDFKAEKGAWTYTRKTIYLEEV